MATPNRAAILKRKEEFDRELLAYRGDDPLKLRFEFLLWLDKFGKDQTGDIFKTALGETLNAHWNDAKYKDDSRLINLQMIFASVHEDPASVYKGYFERGIAQQRATLYINWTEHLVSQGDYREADRVFLLGLDKVSTAAKDELKEAHDKFLASVGRSYLDGLLGSEKGTVCKKCSSQTSSATAGSAVSSTFSPMPTEDVVHIEMNPGKAGEWDDFITPVAHFDEPNPKQIRMYPKDKVYKDPGKEFSLEEIKAAERVLRRYKRRSLEEQKMRESGKHMVTDFEAQFEADRSAKGNAYPTPLLPSTGKEDSISAQSFTTRTKAAMNLVQDMWSSPTPELVTKVEDRENKPKTPFPIYMDEHPETPKAAERKPLAPFAVFADSPDRSQASEKQSTVKKIATTGKKNGLNMLSDRKPPSGEVIEDLPASQKQVVKQQLQFDSENANILANKLSEASVSEHHTPKSFQPFGGIKPLFPGEPGKDDFSDVTCNTKAFNFALPSSTPVQQRKSLAPYHSAHNSNGSAAAEDRPSYVTQQNLSVILEASKERFSSSDVPKLLMTEDFSDVDPFNPELIEKLLSLINFPLSHHVAGYHVTNSNLPSMTKNVRLGSSSLTTCGEIGKGAYARVVKGVTQNNTTVALKVEKPACKWEYYIAKEIQRRMDPKMKSAFMDISEAYIFSNGSILITDWAKYGNLLDVVNVFKRNTGKGFEPVLSLHFCIEIMKVVEYLHKCKIIHGDIKPDNFVMRSLPSVNETDSCLMLIDFGRCIDMTLFPEGTKFSRVVTTEGFQCNEMKEHRPWNYQTDLYGLAGTMYCVLVGDYMKVEKKKNCEWKLSKALPRNHNRDLWEPIFGELLNIPSCERLPNLTEMRKNLEGAFTQYNSYIINQYFNHLANVVLGK